MCGLVKFSATLLLCLPAAYQAERLPAAIAKHRAQIQKPTEDPQEYELRLAAELAKPTEYPLEYERLAAELAKLDVSERAKRTSPTEAKQYAQDHYGRHLSDKSWIRCAGFIPGVAVRVVAKSNNFFGPHYKEGDIGIVVEPWALPEDDRVTVQIFGKGIRTPKCKSLELAPKLTRWVFKGPGSCMTGQSYDSWASHIFGTYNSCHPDHAHEDYCNLKVNLFTCMEACIATGACVGLQYNHRYGKGCKMFTRWNGKQLSQKAPKGWHSKEPLSRYENSTRWAALMALREAVSIVRADRDTSSSAGALYECYVPWGQAKLR